METKEPLDESSPLDVPPSHSSRDTFDPAEFPPDDDLPIVGQSDLEPSTTSPMVVGSAALPVALGLASWWFTEPLDDRPTDPPARLAESDAPPPKPAEVDPMPVWPEGTIQGDPAKILLLASTKRAAEHLGRVETYTATLRKQERLSGRLGPENTLAMKVRNPPFCDLPQVPRTQGRQGSGLCRGGTTITR